jgi:hypothetical protein
VPVTGALGAILACENGPSLSNPGLPLVDHSGFGEVGQGVFLKTYSANALTGAPSASAYLEIFDRFMQAPPPGTLKAFKGDPRLYQEWAEAHNVFSINYGITKGLVNGNQELANASNWLELGSTNPVRTSVHRRLLQTIGLSGIDGQTVQFVGYYPEVSQTKQSNIIRQVLVVRFENEQFVVKVQSASQAVKEIGSLMQMQLEDPSIQVASTTTFKFNKNPANKLTFTLSDLIVGPNSDLATGRPAMTVNEALNQGIVLSDAQKSQLLSRYRVTLVRLLDPDKPIKFLADGLANGDNMVFNSNLDIVTVDGHSFPNLTHVTNDNGTMKASNRDIDNQVEMIRQFLRRAGIGEDLIKGVDLEVMNKNADKIAVRVEPGKVGAMNVLDDAGNVVHGVSLQNDLDAPIVVPQRMSMSTWTKVAWGINIAGGTMIVLLLTKEFLEKVISTDRYLEADVANILDPHNRVDLPEDAYENMYNNEHIYGSNLRAHKTFSVNLETMRTMIERHRWWKDITASSQPETQKSRLQLRLLDDNLAADSLDAWVELDADQNGRSQLVLSSKTPVITEGEEGGDGQKTLVLVADEHREVIDSQELKEISQGRLDSAVDAINAEFRLLPAGEKINIINYLRTLKEEGYIDFYSLTANGYIAYGKQTGDSFEVRYLGIDDTASQYQYTDGLNYRYLQKAVSIKELVQL